MRRVLKTSRRGLAFFFAVAAFSATASASPGPPPTAVPEIDPSAISGALTLLVGGMLTLADKRRSK